MEHRAESQADDSGSQEYSEASNVMPGDGWVVMYGFVESENEKNEEEHSAPEMGMNVDCRRGVGSGQYRAKYAGIGDGG